MIRKKSPAYPLLLLQQRLKQSLIYLKPLSAQNPLLNMNKFNCLEISTRSKRKINSNSIKINSTCTQCGLIGYVFAEHAFFIIFLNFISHLE